MVDKPIPENKIIQPDVREASPQPVIAEAGREYQLAPPRRYSKGGLIAACLLTALCAAAVTNRALHGMFNIAIFSGYVVANVALFWRAFRPPLRWWQGILVWVGGLAAGTSFAPFVGPPTFEEQAIGREKMLPANLGVFIMILALGLVLIWFGTWRRKGSGTSSADK